MHKIKNSFLQFFGFLILKDYFNLGKSKQILRSVILVVMNNRLLVCYIFVKKVLNFS